MADENNNQRVNLFGDVFIYDENSKKSQCILLKNGEICRTKLNGSRPFNLKRHVKSVHPEFDCKILENNHLIDVSEKAILDAWAEIVTINGRPFSSLHDSGIDKLMKLLIKLTEHKIGAKIHINIDKVKTRVSEISEEMRKQIMLETKDNLISLALDICTKNNRVILGINIQYILNGEIVVRTLGMPRLTQSHTAKHVADIVKETLQNFGISVIQIYCVTTDNASYMLLCPEVLDFLAEAEASNEAENSSDLNEIDGEFFHQMLKDAVAEYFEKPLADFVYSVPCGVHTFQLAIKDALHASTLASNIIESARTIVKKLKTPSVITVMKEQKLHLPILDNLTRWDGKYTMVSENCVFKFRCN